MQLSLPVVAFIVLLVLKLTHAVAWSWLWITAPLWIPVGLSLLFIPIAFVIFAVFGVVLWRVSRP